MSDVLQGVIVGVLVLAAAAYAVWRLGPASLRRKLGKPDAPGGSGCSGCSANSAPNKPPLHHLREHIGKYDSGRTDISTRYK
jgi:hypothetical protein